MIEDPHVDLEDVVRLAVHQLIDQEQITGLAKAHVAEFPTDGLYSRVPYVAIELVDGTQDYFEATGVVDLDFFASTRAGAKNLAAATLAGLLLYPRSVQVGTRVVTIDDLGVTRVPVKMPWEDPEVRRQSATIQLSARR